MKLFPLPFFATVLIIVVVLVGVGAAMYFSVSPVPDTSSANNSESKPNQQAVEMKDRCLQEDEEAEYQLIDEKNAEDSAVIIVKDKATRVEIRQFTVPLSSATHYHPLELHRCLVYAVRAFNYDYKRGKVLPGYRIELVGYDLRGNENIVLDLKEFSLDFRVDPSERYLVLKRGYLGSPDFAVVIKNSETLEDVLVLPMAEARKKSPDIIGEIGLKDWTRDGRYFWADFFGGAPVFGYIRVDSADWTYELFPAPQDVLGGDQLNLETGWLTVHPGNVWYGVSELTEEEKAKRRAQGIGTDLYLHNLFTGQRLFVVHTDEPLHYFKPKWISDTELEYTLPSGEKKIYKIQR